MGWTSYSQPRKYALACLLAACLFFLFQYLANVRDGNHQTRADMHKDPEPSRNKTQYPKASAPMDFRTGLFQPIRIGDRELTHRVVLAPLTRNRASSDGVPNVQLSKEYYGQRTTKGGLLIAEGTYVSHQAVGYPRAPGIFTDKQKNAWKDITHAVKERGGHFFLQLWHCGRVSHSKLQKTGQLPVAPSAISIPGVHLPGLNYQVPHELDAQDEIPSIVLDYRLAAKNAFLAGFDGIEIHAANGFLIDQFMHSGSNNRTDTYGGAVENRTRFLFQVLEGVQEEWKTAVGKESPMARNVGIRLSPFGTFNKMSDSNETELFHYVLRKLNDYKLAYVHVIQPRVSGTRTVGATAADEQVLKLMKLCRIPIITAGGYTEQSGHNAVLQGGQSDPPQEIAVAYGRHFISNPDLPLRIYLGAPLAPYNRSTFYTPGAIGYTDQPFLTDDKVRERARMLSKQFGHDHQTQTALEQYVLSLRYCNINELIK